MAHEKDGAVHLTPDELVTAAIKSIEMLEVMAPGAGVTLALNFLFAHRPQWLTTRAIQFVREKLASSPLPEAEVGREVVNVEGQ